MLHTPRTDRRELALPLLLEESILQVAVFLSYLISAQFGLDPVFARMNVSPVWPASGIALSAILLFGYRVWPAILAAAFVANFTTGLPPLIAIGIAVGNTLECLLGAFLLRGPSFHNSLDSLHHVFRFLFLSAGLSTALGATAGVATLCLTGVAQWGQSATLWKTWWLGDATGDLFIVPLVLAWKDRSPWHKRSILEITLFFVLLVVAGRFIFFYTSYPIAHLIFPFLIWAAFRFGNRGVTAALLVLSAIAIWGTVMGHGPFSRESTHDSLLLLQTFLAAWAITGLVMAAAVHERRRAERGLEERVESRTQELRESEGRFRDLIEATMEGIAILDERQLLDANRSFARLFRYDLREVMGKDFFELVSKETHGTVVEKTREETAQPYELVGLRKDGTTFPMEVVGKRCTYRGRPARVKAVHDVTERKRTERMKDHLISVVSHELRAPLTSVLGALGTLPSHLTGRLTSDADALIHIAQRNSQRLLRLIDRILDLERIGSGKLSLDLHGLELGPLVEQAIDMNRPYAEGLGVRIELQDAVSTAKVNVDADAFIQVLTNLLTNAAKFSPIGGTITIAVAAREGGVRISVIDRGSGIPEDFRTSVFQRFARADAPGREEQRGSGLGLSISKEIVEALGGTIAFESKEGIGTEFYFDLPLCPEVGESPGHPDQNVPEPRKSEKA
ncbi:MAG: MASE1 domain-containing protein [Acidobacteria bacterium]|nr:MASE1 domain-containing protein [Acidobacteriota bacterium]